MYKFSPYSALLIQAVYLCQALTVFLINLPLKNRYLAFTVQMQAYDSITLAGAGRIYPLHGNTGIAPNNAHMRAQSSSN